MRSFRLFLAFMACLGAAQVVHAATISEELIGSWELVGVGSLSGGLRDGDYLHIDFRPSGQFENRTPGETDAEPFKVLGDWALTDDVLRMSPHDGAARKLLPLTYRVSWDGATLMLTSLAKDDAGDPPLRFERRHVK